MNRKFAFFFLFALLLSTFLTVSAAAKTESPEIGTAQAVIAVR